jgi:hypothetical protein
LAKWFADQWQAFGFISGVHLRRFHYQLISQDPPPILPNGTPYENTNNCWCVLGQASKYARYLGLIDPECFVDRRNGAPLLFAPDPYDFETEPEIYANSNLLFESFDFPSFPRLPSFSVNNFMVGQPYILEIWCEKSTMNDVLEPLCRKYQVNFITGLGEMSLTHCKLFVDRLARYNKPCRILYVSDFDPAGLSMPVAVSRKIEKFLTDSNFDVKLFPLILTHEQCLAYHLPRTPIKPGEKRAGRFEERFGAGATELDALQALHPGVLRQIVEDAILHFYDATLQVRVDRLNDELSYDLGEVWTDVLAEHGKEIKELEKDHEALRIEFQSKMDDFKDRIKNEWQGIRSELAEAAPDIDDYELPEPEEAQGLGEGLFDSRRAYMEQLKFYKDFQGRLREPDPVNDVGA